MYHADPKFTNISSYKEASKITWILNLVKKKSMYSNLEYHTHISTTKHIEMTIFTGRSPQQKGMGI